MLDLYLKGGFLMHPILMTSVVVLTIVLERWWYFRRVGPPDIGGRLDLIEAHLSEGKKKEAFLLASGISGPVGRILREGLEHSEEDPEILEERMTLYGEAVLKEASWGLSLLALLPSISTMLGLLGTVVGLTEAFQKVAEMQAQVSPALLASGIWAALMTTVAGLFIAIPTLIAHHYFQAKRAHLAFQMEQYGGKLILLLKQSLKKKGHLTQRVLSGPEIVGVIQESRQGE